MSTNFPTISQQSSADRTNERDEVKSQTRFEHSGLADIMHDLQSKLAIAAPGRKQSWLKQVLIELRRLREGFREHIQSAGERDGLFSELDLAAPHRIPQFRMLQRQQGLLLQEIDALISEIDHLGKVPDFSNVRRRASALMLEVREIQALENDHILECFQTDLGVGD